MPPLPLRRLPARSLPLALRAALLATPVLAIQPVQAQTLPSAQRAASQPYAIPAGPLSSALSRFASEAGILLAADAQLTQGKQSPGVQGTLTVDDGLARLLQGSGLQAVRDSSGNYSLMNLPDGDGVTLGTTTVQGFALGNALGSMEGYNATHSSVATKTSLPLAETSQTVSVVTRQQMDDQGSRTVAQAVRYTPGVMSSPYGATTRYDYVAMRGINDGSVDNIFLDGQKLLGDSGTYSSLQVDPFFIERIDILKGPSSVLYGRSLPGGLVALTSKKPEYQSHRHLELSYGSQDERQAALDLTGPLTDQVAYRLAGVARKAGNQVDGVDEERYALMPSLSIDLAEETRLTLLAMLQHDPSSGYHGGLPASGTVTSFNGQRISRSFFEGDDNLERFKRDQQMLGYQLEHRFNDVVSARQNLMYVDSRVDSRQVYQYGYTTSAGDLYRAYTGANEVLHAWSLDNQLQFEFNTGWLSHTLVTGLDYQRRWAKVDYDSAAGALTSSNPYTDYTPPAGLTTAHQYDESRQLKQTGLYVQDLISLDRWRFSLGARQDWVDVAFQHTEDAYYGDQSDHDKDSQFTGRVGVLYAFDNGVSPYVSYSESFNPNTTSAYNQTTTGWDLALLKPTKGKQYEAGVKYQPPGTDNLFTASVFELTESNLASKDSNESFYRAVGEIESRGVELEARAKPVKDLDVIASYTYLDVEYTKDFVGTAGVNNKGNTPTAVARNMASLWASYHFSEDALAGLQLGAGVRYFGRSWADPENTLRIPAYTLYDALVGYDLGQVGLKGVGVRVNLNNLTDEKYVAACNSLYQCYYGEGRNVMATVSYDF